jgi:voltage-gated potassium channel
MEVSGRRLVIAILVVLLVNLAGVIGYQLIEGWSFFDSLYMTVTTLATVGFGEVHPLSAPGRAFTIFLILVGVGALSYGISAGIAFVVEGSLTGIIGKKKMESEIKALREHVILCGIGDTGRHIAEEFLKVRIPFIVIEKDRDRIKQQLEKIGSFLYVEGDASNDETLLQAQIAEAKGLVTALPQDRDNVFVTLTARGLNPHLRIVAKVIDLESRSKLIKAGADSIVCPESIGGLRMASEMIRPTVVSFLDTMLRASADGVRVEEAKISPGSTFVGLTLADSKIYEKTGLVVIAVARNNNYELNPSPSTELHEGDGLIVCGSVRELDRLRHLVLSGT